MSKIFDFTEKAVRAYLRTVILIDDKAFELDSRGDGASSGSSTLYINLFVHKGFLNLLHLL